MSLLPYASCPETLMLDGLQMASEVNFDLKFGISNLNYPGISVHIGGLWGHGGLQTTSITVDRYDLGIEVSDFNFIGGHVSGLLMALFQESEGETNYDSLTCVLRRR